MNRHQGIALWGAIITSVIVLALYCFVTAVALVHEFTPAMKDIVLFVAGNVNAMALAVVGYWVGSSAGSLIKTATASGTTEVQTGPK